MDVFNFKQWLIIRKIQQCICQLQQQIGGSVTTEDSDTVTFTGVGSADDPLVAEVVTSVDPEPDTIPMRTADGRLKAALATEGDDVMTRNGADDRYVQGPVSSTNNAVARFNLATGKLIKNSTVTMGDTGITTFPVGARVIVGVGDDATSILQVGGTARVTSTITCGGTFISNGGGGQSFQGITSVGSTGGVVGSAGTFTNHGFDFYTNNVMRGTIMSSGRWWIGPTLADDGANRMQINGGLRVFGGTITGAVQNGNTAARPATPALGQMYFDTQLSPAKPIWYNGTNWVDATGATV